MAKAKYREITNNIIQSIERGELKPGDRIASIRELSGQYKVSQITVLRVFRELSGGGYITRRDGTGYYVSETGRDEQGNTLIYAFRPLREINDTDNFGNRIIYGIISASLAHNLNIFIPKSITTLRSRVPAETEVIRIAEEIAGVEKPAGVVLDMRYSDEMIKRHILPVCRKIPLIVVGRQSALPVFSVSVPMKKCGRDAARLALKSTSERFIVYPAEHLYDGKILCEAFRNELLKNGIADDNITFLGGAESSLIRDREIFQDTLDILHSSKKRVLLFSCSDTFSVNLCQILSEANLIPGRDVGLISYGGFDCAYRNRPKITTIAADAAGMGTIALDVVCKNFLEAQNNFWVNYKIDVNETL